MKSVVFTVCLWVLPLGAAFAEPLIVRSGEHETFTRLVIPLPERNSTWRLENEPGSTKIVFDDFDEGFNLSFAFEIIPRTRLTALVGRSSELVLQLPCDCLVNAFVERDAFLVLDIQDGQALNEFANDSIPDTALPPSNFAYGDLLWMNDSNLSASNEAEPNMRLQDRQSEMSEAGTPEVPHEMVRETQSRLLNAFSAAASQGLIAPKTRPAIASVSSTSNNSEPEIYDSSEIAQEIASSPSGHIRITDSKDIPDQHPLADVALSGAKCPEAQAFNVENWGSNSKFALQLASSSSLLFDETGRINKESVLRHARLYLYFGLGAEAKDTIGLVPGLAEAYPELTELASIMEYGYSKYPKRLQKYADCSSNVALWGIVAGPKIPGSQAINAKAALRALDALPSHLKLFLSQTLGNRLLERGDTENAAIALRIHERLEENKSNIPTIASAELESLKSNQDEADAILDGIVTEQTPEAPEAVVSIIQNYIDKDVEVPAETALLAESYAFEFRNSERGPEMLRAFVLATAKSMQFEKTFELLGDSYRMAALDEETAAELRSYAFLQLAKFAENSVFLKGYFSYFPNPSLKLENEALVEIAVRMLRMGFTEEAASVASKLTPDFQTNDRKILNANLLSIAKRYKKGLNELEGITGPEAARIRGEIMENLGENQSAAANFNEANLPIRAVSSLWLSEEWSELVPSSNPTFGDFSLLSSETIEVIEPSQNMLEQTAEAILSSSEARSRLQSALKGLSVNDEEEVR